MQVYGMDPVLIQIYNIRNIESIKIWDMRVNATKGILIVPGILVTYDGGKSLNLTSKDKYFGIYVKKVMQVYGDEKNNILENRLTDPFQIASKINIDDYTRSILESGQLLDLDEVYRFYYGKDAYESSLLFQEDEVKLIMPIVTHHIERLFRLTDKNIIFTDEISGYRDHYVISGELDGIEKSFPFIFDKISDTEYEISMGGIIRQSLPIVIRVSFKKDRIDVVLDTGQYELRQESSYRITNGMIKQIHDVTRNGLTISYKNEDVEQSRCEHLNIANDDEEANLTWFKLPWGAYYGMNFAINELSDIEKIIEVHNMYLGVNKNGFIKQEFYSKTYKRNNTVTVKADELELSEVVKRQIGVSNDVDGKIFVIETLFNDQSLDSLSSESKGRYFYHGCYSENGIDGIREDMLVSLTKDKSILSNSDLLNKYKILKYVRKGD